ncbi:hypothetical protein HKX48_002368 [Thoreauomyces humboldtii]|nr:hypothetical protein HKX48_002368 [Thoreauomyces humboldtii]
MGMGIGRSRHPDLMTLDIGTLTGRFYIQVHAADQVGDVKRRIQEMEGIAMESQILIWREKALADDSTPISAFGIQDGSRMQLVLHMSTGPGPPMKIKQNVKDDDPVVLLLCKEDDDMYMLEFHMTDIRDSRPDRRRLLQLAELAGLEVFHDLSLDASSFVMNSLRRDRDQNIQESEEDLMSQMRMQMQRRQSEEMREIGMGMGEMEMGRDTRGDRLFDSQTHTQTQTSQEELERRPDSGDSCSSTNSFRSIGRSSSTDSLRLRRPLSPSSSNSNSTCNTRPSSGESAMQDLLRDVLGLKSAGAYKARGYPRTARRRVRPATAISVMRIPGGTGPMIIIPKTRPASAIQLAKRRSVMDDTPPATPPTERAVGSSDVVGGLCTKPRSLPQERGKGKPTTTGGRRLRKRRSSMPMPMDYTNGEGPSPCSSSIDTDLASSTEHVNEFTSLSGTTTGRRGGCSRVIKTGTITMRQRGMECLHHQDSTSSLSALLTTHNQPNIADHPTNTNTNTNNNGRTEKTSARTDRPRSKRDPNSGSGSLRTVPPRTPVTTVITSRRCFSCKKKIGPATSFKCRCNQMFCSVHRYSDRHSCVFDYRGAGKIMLAKENPPIKKEKLEKI